MSLLMNLTTAMWQHNLKSVRNQLVSLHSTVVLKVTETDISVASVGDVLLKVAGELQSKEI
jgi:hypothetical protein